MTSLSFFVMTISISSGTALQQSSGFMFSTFVTLSFQGVIVVIPTSEEVGTSESVPSTVDLVRQGRMNSCS